MKVPKSKLAFITLLIATIIIQGYSIYVYSTVEETYGGGGYCYMVEPLDHEPEKYWDLAEPDPYILEAIEHPGNWTEPFVYKDSTFWFTAEWHDPDYVRNNTLEGIHPVPFKYNGTYYNYSVVGSGIIIGVRLLVEEPEEYWNLTNPNKYLLEAIENPGKSIAVGCDVSLSDLLKQLPPCPFQYNGKYYDDHYVITYLPTYPLPSPFKPERTAMVLAGVWVAAGSVYLLKKKKK